MPNEVPASHKTTEARGDTGQIFQAVRKAEEELQLLRPYC